MNVLDQNYQAFLEAAPDAIVVVDREGVIVGLNALTEAMFGYSRAELLDQPVELLVPERFHAGHQIDRSTYSKAPRTRPMGLDRELWGRRKSGEEFVVQISLSPISSGGETLVTSIIRDVTAQRAAEARFRSLLESAPDGIVVVDSQGTIVIVNSQTERLFGYTRQELIGEPIEMLVPDRVRAHHQGDRLAYVADPKLRPMGAGRALSGRTKAGQEFPVEISLSPLVTDQGRMVMSIIRDITERRRAEEIIEASLREKEALLKEIHHRVKNNLQVTSSLLRLQAAAIDDPRAREMFEETESRIRSMALVHEKLYQSTNLSRIDFASYVQSLGELLFRSSAITPGNREAACFGTGDVSEHRHRRPVRADRQRAAVERVEACLSAGPLRRDLRPPRHRAPTAGTSVSIRDDGVGLPVSFDLNRSGTLGLQLVQGLVQQIDGHIAIERAEPGARFIIEFPAERSR